MSGVSRVEYKISVEASLVEHPVSCCPALTICPQALEEEEAEEARAKLLEQQLASPRMLGELQCMSVSNHHG